MRDELKKDAGAGATRIFGRVRNGCQFDSLGRREVGCGDGVYAVFSWSEVIGCMVGKGEI